MIRSTVSTFAVPSHEERKSFISLEKNPDIHAATLASLTCMNTVRHRWRDGRIGAPCSFPSPWLHGTWSAAFSPSRSAAKLKATHAPLVLLSEMDEGMARTQQRDPTAIVAGELGMAYAYGVEFLELSLGSQIEHSFCKHDFNEKGFHGNALMASTSSEECLPVPPAGRSGLVQGQ